MPQADGMIKVSNTLKHDTHSSDAALQFRKGRIHPPAGLIFQGTM